MPSIEQLEGLLAMEPDDVFLNFGLAMALASAGKTQEAALRFEKTISLDPGYVAAYFQKGRMLADLGKTQEARAILERGIETARAVGDQHAMGEMSEFLSMM